MKCKREQGKAKATHHAQTDPTQSGPDQNGGQNHCQLQCNHDLLSVNANCPFIIGNECKAADFLSVVTGAHSSAYLKNRDAQPTIFVVIVYFLMRAFKRTRLESRPNIE
ncbi:hypothetical protein GCM10010971_33060 [Silvimonas amylolytica]|uniref:Uncharacterized protein n=1 Tax=Silvimonas amylolytica TaxID=449663 RepID=A0ABQ2PR79_9NEIS|nr:hypothetical protein GCM10010971_33060 [Silvimonas amylolytica]